jgi:predicted transcriptional regulator
MDILLEKKKVLKSLQSSLPEKFSVDTIIERILFLQAVEEGLEQSTQGNVVNLDEAKKRFEKWLK